MRVGDLILELQKLNPESRAAFMMDSDEDCLVYVARVGVHVRRGTVVSDEDGALLVILFDGERVRSTALPGHGAAGDPQTAPENRP